jgi:hypothetical protein
MPLLSDILNKHIDADIFSHNKKKIEITININVDDEESYYFYYYFSKIYNNGLHNKFNILKELDENIFISESLKLKIQYIFCKLQKTYYGFSRLAYLWKYKKANIQSTDDFSLNPIDINKKNVFVLFQNNSKFLFVSNDLINIVNTNLSNSPDFFCYPLWIKNPYNNIKLTNCDLYNIYFFLKFKVCNVPLLLELFFKSNFDLKLFAYDNEAILRSFKIDDYVKCSDNLTLYKTIIIMIQSNNDIMHNIQIDKEFPRDVLIHIMRPYLKLYINSKYAIIGTEKRNYSESFLRNKLHKFAKFNPLFGRKIIKTSERFGKIIGPVKVSFNDKHIDFNDNSRNYFIPEPYDVTEYDSESESNNNYSDGEDGGFIYDESDNESESENEQIVSRNIIGNRYEIIYDENDDIN